MRRHSLFGSDGTIRQAPRQGTPFRDTDKRREKREDAGVCLNCTRKKCRGTSECFRREKAVQG